MKKLGATILLVLPCLLLFGLQVIADSTTTWFTLNQAISVTPISGELLGMTDSYNVPCTNATFNYYSISSWNMESSGEKTSCLHSAGYGEIARDGGVLFSGTSAAYQIRPSDGSIYEKFYPVPGTSHIFTTNGGTGNSREYFYIYKNFPSRFTIHKSPNTHKTQYYKLASNPFDSENRVKFQNGELTSINPLSLSYATNGSSMIGNYGSFQVLINNETLVARKFGFNTPSYSGSIPKVNTALSSTGNLALVNVSDGPDSKLYDLTQCTGATDGSVVENCKSLDVFAALKSKLPSLKSITRAQFSSDSTIYLQARVSTPQGIVAQWYKVQLPQGGAVDYLALGDSFASGEGAHNYKPGTDQADNKCHTSLSSYAHLIKSHMSFSKSENIACSGAVQKDVRIVSESVYSLNDPQAKNKDDKQYDEEVYTNFMPGYRRQIKFIEKYKPASATLSIGGNDIGFSDKLTWCVLSPHSCYILHSSRAGLLKEVKAQFPNLVKTYTDLKQASPETKFYIIGYPNIAKPGGQCAYNVRLTNEEIELAEAIVADLNYVIQKAAEKAGVLYVDVTDAFDGHRMCETATQNVAVNGLTLGDDMASAFGYSLLGKESYHPNQLGHQLYKEMILAKTDNLTKPMPGVNDSADVKDMPGRLATDASTLSVPLPLSFMNEKERLVKRGINLIFDTAVNSWLEPGTNYRVEIHSAPQDIGSATVKDMNTLSLNIQVPENVEPGPHTIHIYAKNVAGEPIDLYKEIIVIGSEEDYDGDGVTNVQDNCPFMEVTTFIGENTENEICTYQLAQPDEGEASQSEPPAANYLPPPSAEELTTSASSSNNNSLTTLLDASPLGRIATTLNNNYFGILQEEADAIPDLAKGVPAKVKNRLLNAQDDSDWKRFLILLGAGMPAGAAVLLRARKSR